MRAARLAGRLLGLAVALSAWGAAAQEGSTQQAHQEGLYLQMTRGDLPAALDAFVRALQVAGTEETDAVLLSQAECLEWAGDRVRQHGVLSILRARSAGLGGLETLPAESDLLVQLDLKRLADAPAFQRFSLEIDRALQERFFANPGVEQRMSLSRLTLAVSLGADERSPVDHWVVRLDGSFAKLKPVVLERFVSELAIELARSQPGIEVTLNQRPGGGAVLRFGPACCAGEPPTTSLDEMQLHGRSVILARVQRPDQPEGALEVGVARLEDDALIIGERRALERTLAAEARATVGLRANRRIWPLTSRVPADSGLWLVLSPDEIVRQVRKVQAVLGWGGGLPDVTGLLLTGRWGEVMAFSAVAWTSNTEAARALADLARGGLALLRLTTAVDAQQNKPLQAVIDGLRIDLDGREVRVRATLPEAVFRPPAAVNDRRRLEMPVDSQVRLALEKVGSLEISDPEVVEARFDKDGIIIRSKRVGQTVLRITRPGRPDQQLEVVVSAPR